MMLPQQVQSHQQQVNYQQQAMQSTNLLANNCSNHYDRIQQPQVNHYQHHQNNHQTHLESSPVHYQNSHSNHHHHQLVLNPAGAPPTPPSEDGIHQQTAIYQHQQHLSPTHQNQQQHQQHYQQQHQPQHQPQHQHQHQNRWVSTNQQVEYQQQQQPIDTNYYYDIDDGFSDIQSAPSSPEPAPICQQHLSYSPNHASGIPSQVLVQQQHQDEYQNYLPFNQQQQYLSCTQLAQTMAYDSGIQYAMSPDSSSLSTTSSSPSDHSLYQSVGGNIILEQRADPQPQQQPQPQQLCLQAHQAEQRQETILMAAIKQERQLLAHTPPPAPNQPQQRPAPIGAELGQGKGLPNQQRSSPIHLWEFLKELLQQVDAGFADQSVIRWMDRQKGVFKIEDSVRVAKLWGKRKNKPKMNYDKLSRSIRQYYKKGIMRKTDRSQRLVYQFCSAYCH